MPGSVLVEGDAPAMGRQRKYSDELRERAVRHVLETKRPIAHVAEDLGIHKEALRLWVRQAEADAGEGADLLSADERAELKRLRQENVELKRANAILKDASVFMWTARLCGSGAAAVSVWAGVGVLMRRAWST
jgi:transposase